MIENFIKILLKCGLSIVRTIQILIIFILSILTWTIQYNNCTFIDRWAFESVNFGTDKPDPIICHNIFETLKIVYKSIWKRN